MAKARDLLHAVRVLKRLEAERRPPAADERTALARFGGFGAVALRIFPDPVTGRYKSPTWQGLGEELSALLDRGEYASARRTVFNAFYTSPTVVAAMFEALNRLGVPEDATVLEPGCGTGNFLRLAPEGMHFIGVELDSLSGRIARALYPDHDIRIENFRDTKLPEGSVDAVIGNPPFADVKLEHRGTRFSLHDFFFAKSLDALKPGGILALVTTHYTLDKQNAAVREYLADTGRLPRGDPAAVGRLRPRGDEGRDRHRLPAGNAGPASRHGHVDPSWLEVSPLAIEGVEVPINRYFLDHPEMVLGHLEPARTGSTAASRVTASPRPAPLEDALRAAVGRLPELEPAADRGLAQARGPGVHAAAA